MPMYLYRLGDDFLPVKLYDDWESLIWTDRLTAWGDFELVMPYDYLEWTNLAPNRWFSHSHSKRVMRLESRERYFDQEGQKMMKFVGRSMESHLENIVFRRNTTFGYKNGTYMVSNNLPKFLANWIPSAYNAVYPDDAMPVTFANGLYPADTVPESQEVLETYLLMATPMYGQIKELCDTYGMGFRFALNKETGQLYFDIFTGRDRTTRQKTDPAVVFGGQLGNLLSEKLYETLANWKNLVRVYPPGKTPFHGLKYHDVSDPIVRTGFSRRTMEIVLEELPDFPGTTTSEWLMHFRSYATRKGREALAQQRWVTLFDGEVSADSGYEYERDYNLGDILEIQSEDSGASYVRAVEQIFISDAEGERSFPALA